MEQGDPFDRQRRIENWDQTKIEKSVCLLLGTGGLGCSVAMGLARLGVGKMILIDKDVVDISNLNRQILFDHNDVNKPKVEVVKEKIISNHLINKSMIVESYNMCALKNWRKIIDLSKEATVVFNMIDVGDYFDAAVQALCTIRQIPLILGGTFSQQFTVDYFKPGEACLICASDTYSKDELEKILPSKIESLPDLEFIPRNNNPIGQSNAYLCVICSMMMVSRFSTSLINDPEVIVNPRFIMTVNSADAIQFPICKEEKCSFCNDYDRLINPDKYIENEAESTIIDSTQEQSTQQSVEQVNEEGIEKKNEIEQVKEQNNEPKEHQSDQSQNNEEKKEEEQ